eukprot:5349409-Amphidinium_carterae.1
MATDTKAVSIVLKQLASQNQGDMEHSGSWRRVQSNVKNNALTIHMTVRVNLAEPSLAIPKEHESIR